MLLLHPLSPECSLGSFSGPKQLPLPKLLFLAPGQGRGHSVPEPVPLPSSLAGSSLDYMHFSIIQSEIRAQGFVLGLFALVF